MRLFSLLATAALLSATLAHADTVNFNVQGSAGGFSGSGTLTGTDNGDGNFLITAITAPGVTGLFAVNGFEGNDNLFYPTGTALLDDGGLSFTDVMDGTNYNVNLFFNSDLGSYGVILLDTDNSVGTLLPATFSLATTPEPSSVALLGTGLLGLAGVIRRRGASLNT